MARVDEKKSVFRRLVHFLELCFSQVAEVSCEGVPETRNQLIFVFFRVI